MHLGKFSYFLDFFVIPPVVLFFLYRLPYEFSAMKGGFSLAAVLAGFFAWTFIEYAFHRWLLHDCPGVKHLHDEHHERPEALFGTPPLVGVIQISLCVFLPLSFIGPVSAAGVTAGMLAGYLAYISVHWATHHVREPRSAYLIRARRRHALHHYRAGQTNFGVTTGFWDRLFGTEHLRSGQRAARPEISA